MEPLSEFDLKEQIESLFLAFDCLEHNISIMDRDLNVLWVNKAFVKRLGITKNEAIKKKCYKLWHRRSLPCDNCPCVKALHTGNIEKFERISSEERHYILTAIPIKENNQIKGVLEIGKEITEERLIEKRLREVIKIEGIYETLDNLSHQFNNIFTGIYGFAQLLENRLTDETSLKYLRKLIDGIEKGLKFMHSIANLKKIPSVKRVIDLNYLIISIRELIENVVGEKVMVEFSFTKEVPLISADPFQIREVILELIQNAKNSITDKGIIKISTEKKTVNSEMRVFVVISDNGKGMNEEILKKCFEPLFTTNPTNFGLGLSIVKSIITKHSGEIEIESVPESGTTVKVHFPAVTLPQEQGI